MMILTGALGWGSLLYATTYFIMSDSFPEAASLALECLVGFFLSSVATAASFWLVPKDSNFI